MKPRKWLGVLFFFIFYSFFVNRGLALNESVSMMKGPYETFFGYPLTGDNVIIGIVDSGIDCAQGDFGLNCNKVLDWCDATLGSCVSRSGNLNDYSDHGTHMASLAAGTGESSNGKYTGVAPNAKLLITKAFRPQEYANGVRWLTQHSPKPNVISLSVGWEATNERCNGTTNEGIYKALYDAIQEAIANNIPVVVAAGENGITGTIDFPGCVEAVITVGASDRNDKVWDSSSRGPPLGMPQGFLVIKPDVIAPGVDVCAARSGGLEPELATCDNDKYVRLYGTSLSTAHVAGVIALIKEMYPGATPSDIKYAIKNADFLNGFGPYDQGSGRVNIIKAVNAFGNCFGTCTDNFFCDVENGLCTRCDYRSVKTLVPDPSFEDDVGWNYYCSSRSNTEAASGSWSLYAERTPDCIWYPMAGTISFVVKPSTQYTLRGKYKFVKGPNTEEIAYAYIQWMNSVKGSIPWDSSQIFIDKTDENWHDFSQTFTSTSYARFAEVRIGTDDGYALYFDDIYLSDEEKCESSNEPSTHCMASTICDEKSPETIIDAASLDDCSAGNTATRDKCSSNCLSEDTNICDAQCGADAGCDGSNTWNQGNCPSGYVCNYNCQCKRKGDLNGDGNIDIVDIVIVAVAYGSTPQNSTWNSVADSNADNLIDIFDLTFVAINFGEK